MEKFNIITSKNIMENLTEIKTAPLSEKDIKKATMNVLKNKEVYGAMKALSTKQLREKQKINRQLTKFKRPEFK